MPADIDYNDQHPDPSARIDAVTHPDPSARINAVNTPDPSARINAVNHPDPTARINAVNTPDPSARINAVNTPDPNARIYQGSHPAAIYPGTPSGTQTTITPSNTPPASGGSSDGAHPTLVGAFKRALGDDGPVPIRAVPIDIVLELDGGDSAITDASYGWISRNKIPARILDVTLQNVRGETGSITVDIQTCTPGTSPSWTSICASAIPAISSSDYYYDATLTDWTTVLQRGQGIRAVVSGTATFTQMSICLGARRLDLSAET